MLALLKFALSPAGKALGAFLGVSTIAGTLYLKGRSDGRQAERVAFLKAAVQAYTKREGIDHEVDAMDRYRICLDLGGLPGQCAQLRGLEETATGQ